MAEQENHRKKDALVKCEDRPSRIFAPSRTAVKDAPLWTNFWETGGVRKDEKEATGRGRGEKKEGKVNRRRRCGSLRYKVVTQPLEFLGSWRAIRRPLQKNKSSLPRIPPRLRESSPGTEYS
ncbi:uncharacterized protein LOC143213300 isoform X1 [Lasioglossum baleicum]|uniref:uncharacterized protein LOC143213300 isoform X1 n=1 Tax=Lasioglossum baleicum TaxID=434251 RepID=UPI003FCEAFE4